MLVLHVWRIMEEKELSGFLLINKPLTKSSFWCVKAIRYIFGRKVRVGHAGTLDPYATGLLIIAVGRPATRRIDELSGLAKEYVAEGKLGQMTDSLDVEGEVVQTCDSAHVTQKSMQDAISTLGSSYIQVPPIYSALKCGGLPLYELARQQYVTHQELHHLVQKKSRKVLLHAVDLLSFKEPFFRIKARVSHGTYIRSLVRDIVERVDCCATMTALERIAIGPFSINDAVDITACDLKGNLEKHLISVDDFFTTITNLG